jgi:hypothetical protein
VIEALRSPPVADEVSELTGEEPGPVPDGGPGDDHDGWVAVAELYHRYLTGTILAAVTRLGERTAADVVFRTFRRQHLERFLPGLEKLGLTGLPDAVACARYHTLSNSVGGVKVEWIPESDVKSWVRYLPPRWIFDGTAVCGAPSMISRAMLRGWHGHNGVSLGNPRLGFVCTSQTTDGQPGLCGYYESGPDKLEPDDRLRFAPGETPPPVDPELRELVVDPTTGWPEVRRRKAARNYAMDYVRSITMALTEVVGPADAGHVGRVAGRRIGMQYHDTIVDLLGPVEDGPVGAAELIRRLAAAQGDGVDVRVVAPGDVVVRQRSWRLMRGLTPAPEVFEAWNGLWEGLVLGHDPGLRLDVVGRLDLGDPAFGWRVRARGSMPSF